MVANMLKGFGTGGAQPLAGAAERAAWIEGSRAEFDGFEPAMIWASPSTKPEWSMYDEDEDEDDDDGEFAGDEDAESGDEDYLEEDDDFLEDDDDFEEEEDFDDEEGDDDDL